MMPPIADLRHEFAVYSEAAAPIYRLDGMEPPCDLGDTVLTIGAFDGFHVGHDDLVRHAVADARKRGIAAVAVTFDPDPDEVVGTPALKLTSVSERLHRLAHAGIDAVVVVPFTHGLAAMGHEEFFCEVLGPCMRIRSIHVGENFRLGHHGCSDVSVIARWGSGHAIDVFGHALVADDGEPVSATRIRAELARGEVQSAARHLGRRFSIAGSVDTGRGEGHNMGIPTANVALPAGIQLPAEGVYSGLALVDGSVFPAAINVGLPPTFADAARSAHMEANLIGFAGDVYGDAISVSFSRFLRPSRVFSSTEELVSTVRGNIQDVIDEYGREGVELR